MYLLNFLSPLITKSTKPRKPRTINYHKYKNTVLYEIRATKYPEIFYIGHTINPNTRFEQHKREAETNKNTHLKSKYMRLIGVHNFTFKVIHKFSCNNRSEAEVIEARYIQMLNPPMNTEFLSFEQRAINEEKYNVFSGRSEFSLIYYIGNNIISFISNKLGFGR
jgi:predicted GIY-YIG superfamily endonuclease